MTNMQKYAPSQGPTLLTQWWCHDASQLQVGVGLTRMAATPRLLLPFCSGTLCGRGYGGWFSPSTGRRSGRYVYRHAQDHMLLTRDILFIWWYPWLIPDIKNYPVFRWTVEVRRGVTRPAATARQPGAEMNEIYGMRTSAGISQDNSVLNYYPDLCRVIQVLLSYPNLSRDMQV